MMNLSEADVSSILENPLVIRNRAKGEVKITYSEFRDRVYAMARGLVSIGLKKGAA